MQGTHDFFGLNHYTSEYVANNDNPTGTGWSRDEHVTQTRVSANGTLIGT